MKEKSGPGSFFAFVLKGIHSQKMFVYSSELIADSLTEGRSCPQRTIRSPEHCLKWDRWQGPPHINKARQCEVVLSVYSVYSVVKSLFIQFVSVWSSQRRSVSSSWNLHNAPTSLSCFLTEYRPFFFLFRFGFFLLSNPNLERADERHCPSILFIWKLKKARGQRPNLLINKRI